MTHPFLTRGCINHPGSHRDSSRGHNPAHNHGQGRACAQASPDPRCISTLTFRTITQRKMRQGGSGREPFRILSPSSVEPHSCTQVIPPQRPNHVVQNRPRRRIPPTPCHAPVCTHVHHNNWADSVPVDTAAIRIHPGRR